MEPDVTHYKNNLEEEKKRLTGELGAIGMTEAREPGDWHATVADIGEADFREDVADRLEEFHEREATEVNLEKRLRDIAMALEKIEGGTYGVCEICNRPIELERLNINPAARTCKTHIAEEDTLI